MSAGNYNRNVKYYRFKEGKLLCKNKETGQNETFDFVKGLVTDIRLTDEQYQDDHYKQLAINLFDGEENSIVCMRFGSGYANAFLKMLPNIQTGVEIEISGTYEQIEGSIKHASGMFIKQDDKNVKWYFTKANPNGMPPKQDDKDGKEKYAFQLIFFEQLIQEFYWQLKKVPLDLRDTSSFSFPKIYPLTKNIVRKDAELTEQNESFIPVDDLPF